MDIATVLGLVATFGLVVGSIAVGGSIGAFVDVPSILIVICGTFAVAFINFPLGEVLGSFKIAMKTFIFKLPDIKEQNAKLIEFANVARKEGTLALEKELGNLEDPFLKKGLQMVVDGMDPGAIEEMMYAEIDAMDLRHRTGSKIFASLAATAPAMGLIGTLIGLVQMLQNMDDPSAIGPAMAVALLTTFYGALVANVIFTPFSGKLSHRNEEELMVRGMVVKGLLGIAKGENPHILSQALQAELAPKDRDTEE